MDLSNYFVSRSNYVVQKKHQDIDNGVILERDITTIGGKDYFDENQMPVYNSGNFIITSSAKTPYQKPTQKIVWDTSPGGSDTWTWDDVKDISEEVDEAISIELNPDVYDLRNFAYYGSCVELMRGSINHIINIFPGELYATNRTITIYNGNDYVTLGNGLYLVDNPFGINLYKQGGSDVYSETDDEYLKYFNYGNTYTNYEFFKDDNVNIGEKITDVSYVSKNPSFDDCFMPFEEMGTLTIKTTKTTLEIKVYKGEGDSTIYLSKTSGWHIRPNSKFYNLFKSRLSLFEKTLMNDTTIPKYSPKFDVYKETEYGFEVQLQTFTFPLADGGYNLGITSPSYSVFISKLMSVANFYDENFSDNLYRSMTHEAIKNFDWSYKRNYTEDEEDAYLDGGGRMQKFIRLVGREFDEIKLYIDGIAHANAVSYNKENNMLDYFLTDAVENEGWDYKHIIPSILKKVEKEDKFVEFSDDIQPFKYKSNSDISCYALEPILTHSSEMIYSPSSINNQFSRLLVLNSRYIWRKKGTKDGIQSILSLFGLKDKEWVEDINKCRKKYPNPTSDDLKKVKCECNKDLNKLNLYSTVSSDDWDYFIEECVAVADPIELENNSLYEKFRVINSYHKLISYEEDLNSMNIPTDWRGLMVREIDNKLYPYFGKNKEYDGNPYYQMYGGWLHKDYFFDKDDKVCKLETFTETINKVKTVDRLKDLVSLPYSLLNNGDIYYVKNLASDFITIGSMVYELKPYPQQFTNNTSKQWYYFEVDVVNGSCIVGDTIYRDGLSLREPAPKNYDSNTLYIDTVKPLNTYQDGTYIKIFVDYNGKLTIGGTNVLEIQTLNNIAILNSSNTTSNKLASNYFKLINAKNFNTVSLLKSTETKDANVGWVQLSIDSADYKKVSMVTDYFYGNNPHTSTYQSDLGYEYMDYFIHLFKHSVENDLFNWDTIFTSYCKDDVKLNELSEKISVFGFKDLKSSKNSCGYNNNKDSKIHAVGWKDSSIKNNLTEEISNQTINLKLVNICFKCNDKDKNTRLTRFKYIDSVVLPYLTQVLPSTLIINVKYVTNGESSNIVQF